MGHGGGAGPATFTERFPRGRRSWSSISTGPLCSGKDLVVLSLPVSRCWEYFCTDVLDHDTQRGFPEQMKSGSTDDLSQTGRCKMNSCRKGYYDIRSIRSIHESTHLFMNVSPSVHQLIYHISTNSSIHLSSHTTIHSSNYASIQLSLYPSILPSIYPLTY